MSTDTQSVNEVRLVGRLSQDPEVKTMPSGDELWTFRLVVARPDSPSRVSVDALECSVWTARPRKSVSGWRAGDQVEVTGAVRRRFFQSGSGPVSRVEIEVATAKLIRRRSPA